MPISFILPAILILLLITRQDLAARSVSWFLFPLLAALGAGLCWMELRSARTLILNILVNTGFLLLQFGLLKCWFRWRTGEVAFIDHAIGKGDLLFLLATGCFFSPANFILFYLVSLLLSLLFHLTFGKWPVVYGAHANVPLAGLQAACLILTLAIFAIKGIPTTVDLWKPSN